MFHSYHGSLLFSEGTPRCQSPASAELALATNQPREMKSEATGKRPALQREVRKAKIRQKKYLFPKTINVPAIKTSHFNLTCRNNVGIKYLMLYAPRN